MFSKKKRNTGSRENNGKERKIPSLALGIGEFHELFLDQLLLNTSNLSVAGFWRGVQTFIQCCREKIQQSPLEYSVLFPLRQLRMDLMTFQTIH